MMINSAIILGDVIEDIYVRGHARGISAETPTMVMGQETVHRYFGGAALVSNHLKSFNINTRLITPVPVMRKTRFFIDEYKVFQVDLVNGQSSTEDSIFDQLNLLLSRSDVLIISDNRHGTLSSKEFVTEIMMKAHEARCPIIVDSQVSQSESNHSWYGSCSLMLVNEKEFEVISNGQSPTDSNALAKVARSLDCDLIVKLGPQGSTAMINDKMYTTDATYGSGFKVVDTCGAGDAFLAVAATQYHKGMGDMDVKRMLRAANDYAGLNCTTIGTSIPSVTAKVKFGFNIR